jgi:Domain of unknown function (DUF4351)
MAQNPQETVMALSQAFLEWEQQTQVRSRLAALRSLVILQLTQKLGTIPDTLSQPINLLTSPYLESLALALLNFSNLTELETWLLQTLRARLLNQLDETADNPLPISSDLRSNLQAQIPTAALPLLTTLSAAIEETLQSAGDFSGLANRLNL